ncbi:hypothetical protein QLL95_gp0722 [Cotonvirus japonicus]|uniref:Uncharacterized protein n=1 Tax=Cotonvirus japonicus TaxID=2811091 RepID=A0ABM7NTH7_9VIRU|nr:hypothetical protein QLL95_gp0722 [Cotonvirus japonicus]BCS83401.1 hypothetical protein [Cotonvirus japonicus]
MNISIKKIPAGTRMYLTKKNNHKFYIQPDKTLVNDNLYVAYDVKIAGIVVIPQGTRVIGNWVAESSPSIAVQLQLTKIFLHGSGQDISADSDLMDNVVDYNVNELNGACYLYKQKHYRATSNLYRRIVNTRCNVKTLPDNNRNMIYVEADTQEIPVTLTKDLDLDR